MLRAFRSALVHALRFLERRDVARLIVCALDTEEASTVLWLLYGDAYPLIVDERQCLHVAVAEGCWTASALLLRRLGADQDHSIDRAFDKVVALHRTLQYVFPPSVMYRAVVHGDIQQIQWLHSTTQYVTNNAIEAAAKARQLHVVQWLLDHIHDGEWIQCWLRFEASPADVRAIGWICQTDEQVHFCSLSQAHGFVRRTQNLWDLDARIPDLPLAEPYAAAGDLAALDKLYSLNDERLFSRFAIVRAAANGRLDVAKWMYSLSLHQWPLVDAAIAAAANGHLAVVQWLVQYSETRFPDVTNAALEGGHLDVVRWLRQHESPTLDVSDNGLWSATAKSRKLAAFQYLREECGLTLASTAALFMGIAGDGSLIKYVVEKILPPDHSGETLVFDAARKGTLDSLVYLVETRGQWSRKAFRAALTRSKDALTFAKWIHNATIERSKRLNVPLDTQLDFSDINVLVVAKETGLHTALWLVKNVPEVSTHALVGADAFHPERLPHTRFDVLAEDPVDVPGQGAAVDALLIAYLQFRPQLCLAIQWLPQWAVRANSIKGFDLLERMGHPSLFTDPTRDCILTFSRHAYFMNKLLSSENGAMFESVRVSAWAATYKLQGQLEMSHS